MNYGLNGFPRIRPATGKVFYGSFGDPNGRVMAVGAGWYFDSSGSTWAHYDTAANNINWYQTG